jgi:hypothetical protein
MGVPKLAGFGGLRNNEHTNDGSFIATEPQPSAVNLLEVAPPYPPTEYARDGIFIDATGRRDVVRRVLELIEQWGEAGYRRRVPGGVEVGRGHSILYYLLRRAHRRKITGCYSILRDNYHEMIMRIVLPF